MLLGHGGHQELVYRSAWCRKLDVKFSNGLLRDDIPFLLATVTFHHSGPSTFSAVYWNHVATDLWLLCVLSSLFMLLWLLFPLRGTWHLVSPFGFLFREELRLVYPVTSSLPWLVNCADSRQLFYRKQMYPNPVYHQCPQLVTSLKDIKFEHAYLQCGDVWEGDIWQKLSLRGRLVLCLRVQERFWKRHRSGDPGGWPLIHDRCDTEGEGVVI